MFESFSSIFTTLEGYLNWVKDVTLSSNKLLSGDNS
jgi:hypothetical protein